MTKRFFEFIFATALVIAATIAFTTVQAGEHRQHEAHEHGVAHLNVAVEGSDLTIELFSPAANIVGFEHPPRNQAQKDQVSEARKKLEAAQTLFQLPSKARGRLVRAMVDSDIDSDSTDALDAQHVHGQAEVHDEDEITSRDQNEHEHVQERHSDFKAEYHFICNQPEELAYLDVMLLRVFPGIERIEVQILTDTGQTAKELTAKDYRITF